MSPDRGRGSSGVSRRPARYLCLFRNRIHRFLRSTNCALSLGSNDYQKSTEFRYGNPPPRSL